MRGRYVGIAPDANLVSIKIDDDQGNATVLDAIYGLQLAVDHKDEYGIRVVNLSLESAVGAVDDRGTRGIGDDQIAKRSSQGTTQDGFAKPELTAPATPGGPSSVTRR